MLLKEIAEDDYEKIGRLFKAGLGEEVLEILVETFYNTVSFTRSDTHTTAFKEGHRDLVQVLRQAVDYVNKKEKENG